MTTAATIDPEIKALVEQAKAELAEPGGFGFWDLTDDGLLRVRRDYLRLIEDKGPHPQLDAWLAKIRWVRLVRWCLHMRYGAVDEHLGTKSWDRYSRFGDAPAYSLALDLDKLRWSYRDHPKMPKRGTLRHIVDWERFGDGTLHPVAALDETTHNSGPRAARPGARTAEALVPAAYAAGISPASP